MKIIDTHCHLADDALFSIRREIVEKSKQNSVVAVFNTADSLSSFSRVLTLENENPDFSFSVLGIHPEFALKEEDYFNYCNIISNDYSYRCFLCLMGFKIDSNWRE